MHRDIGNWTRHSKPRFADKTLLSHALAELCKMLCLWSLDRIALGHVGPLPRTANGNEYLLVVDPDPDFRALTAADVLVAQFISRYGVPFIIHSHQGSAFESERFCNMADFFEISKSRTTPYHSRSDGLTARFNGTLQTKIKSIVASSKCDDWEDYIPYLRIAYTVFS